MHFTTEYTHTYVHMHYLSLATYNIGYENIDVNLFCIASQVASYISLRLIQE